MVNIVTSRLGMRDRGMTSSDSSGTNTPTMAGGGGTTAGMTEGTTIEAGTTITRTTITPTTITPTTTHIVSLNIRIRKTPRRMMMATTTIKRHHRDVHVEFIRQAGGGHRQGNDDHATGRFHLRPL